MITYAGKGEEIPRFDKKTSVTIGNFDGVHLGHQELIRRANAEADSRGLKTLVLSFFPHPLWIICPGKAPSLLTPFDVKQRILERYGVDILVAIEFSREFAGWTHHRFLQEILIKRLNCFRLVVGPDFRFGRNREGDIDFLRRSAPFGVDVVPPVVVEGEPVSSTRIRRLLKDGDVSGAARLLGRAYRLSGTVIRGDRRGHKLGFPTANLDPVPRSLVPKKGTYLTRTLLDGGGCYTSVTNIGINPTFGDSKSMRVETHLIEFQGDLLEKDISIEFIERIRDEMRFSSSKELISQIKQDVLYAMRVCEVVNR